MLICRYVGDTRSSPLLPTAQSMKDFPYLGVAGPGGGGHNTSGGIAQWIATPSSWFAKLNP